MQNFIQAMRYFTKLGLLLLVYFIALSCQKEKQVHYLTGKVNSPEISSILLLGVNQDLRFDSIIEIPVENGKFKYQLQFEDPRAFDLMLGSAKENNGGRIMPIFLHNSDVDLEIYEEKNFDQNIVKGGKLNKEFRDFENYKDSIFEKNPGLKFEDEIDLRNSYIVKNPSIVSYFFYLNNLNYFQDLIDTDEATKQFKILSESNKNHPYNELAKDLLQAMKNVKIGNNYIDFSAPDLNGEEFKLSSEIEGKIALLDLWATWCGPCIKKSREVIPIYEEYKHQGFTVIGVAGEFKSTERLKRFLEKEKWPWKNLVELDRKNNIWKKYGVDGAGGAMFLIDKNGKLIAIDPNPEKIRSELEKRLVQ